jgi:hypothetical protein
VKDSSSSSNSAGGASPPSPLTRYDITTSKIGYAISATLRGEWVKFADVATLTAERDSARVELQRLPTDLLRGETRPNEVTPTFQHLMDVYEALGVRWGDDPFPVIANLRAGQAAGAAEGVSRLQKENVMSEGLLIDRNAILRQELRVYLDTLTITGDNIGDIRRQCFVPWDSAWNAWVRDETASRELRAAVRAGGVSPDVKSEEK